MIDSNSKTIFWVTYINTDKHYGLPRLISDIICGDLSWLESRIITVDDFSRDTSLVIGQSGVPPV